MAPLRVVVASPHWRPRLSGVSDYSWHLAEHLGREGVEVAAMVLGQEHVLEPPGIEVGRAPFPGDLGAIRQVLAVTRALAPDVVCLQFEAYAFERRAVPHLLPLALRLGGWPVVLTYHELWGPRWCRHPAKWALLNAPDAVVTSTEWHGAGVRRFRRGGRPPAIIPVGSNIPPLTTVARALHRTRFGFEESDVVLTVFGFIVPEHGIEEAIVALRCLRDRGRRVHLSIIGPLDRVRSGYHQRLAELARELGVESGITWHGAVEDGDGVARLLAASDIGLLPHREGIGGNNGSFAAFAAAGLPTVTVAGPRTAEIAGEGVAVLAEAKGESLAAAVEELIDDPARRAGFGKRARAWAERRSWERIARAYVEIFQNVLSARGEK